MLMLHQFIKRKKNVINLINLINVSKIYEKLIYNQLYDYFDGILSPSPCGKVPSIAYLSC